jgi:hypothetical protein
MFELFVRTVLRDGSQREVALSWSSLMDFENIHKVSVMQAVDSDLSAKYLTTFAWLAAKQEGPVVSAEKYADEIKAVQVRVERVPFGETESTPQSQD